MIGNDTYERWAKQAVLLEKNGDFSPVASSSAMADIDKLKQLHRQTWKQRERQLIQDGELVALEGPYAGLNAMPPAGSLAVTSINGTAALWTSSLWTPLPGNGLLAPEAFRIALSANITTVATPGNIGFDPRIGAGSTAGSAVAGITLGSSNNVALTASITSSFYYIIGDITIRAIGAPGNTTTAIGLFHYVSTQNTAAGVAGPAQAGHNILFGHTVASFDSSQGGGFSLGAVHTVTTITHTIQQIHWMSWN